MSTDDELREMERYLRKQYQRAGKEVLAKAEEYFKKFESLDKQKQKQVESGKLTEEEYKTWRRNKILYGEHWDKLMNQITGELYKTNQAAAAYVEGKSVKIFAENFNLVEKEIPDVPVKGYTFELVNEETVRQLATTGELMLPPPNPPDKYKDNQWNARQVHAEVLQGILQGDSMDKIALRLRNTVDKNEVSSIRNARTMVTAAENSGRQAGFDKAEKDGIIFKKEWIATVGDGRTRESHLAINGELVDNGELFSNGCEFPGDWRGDPSEVYNCRCTLGSKFIGFKKRQLEEAVREQEQAQAKAQEKKESDQEGNSPVIAGVERGEPMTFEEADNYKTNPNYGKRGYDVNCQSCVPTFEARQRGYDVIVKSKYKNPTATRLSMYTNEIWIDPETGKPPKYVTNKEATNANKYFDFMNETVKQGERYSFEFVWKGRGFSGHVVNLDRNEDGELRIKDNQRGKGELSEWVGDKEVRSYLSQMKYTYTLRGITRYDAMPKMLRIDNMEFNVEVANKIMEAAK